MPQKTALVAAIIGSTLIALLLTGSSRNAANSSIKLLTFEESEVRVLASSGMALWAQGRYLEARDTFRNTADHAQRAGLARVSAMNWNNAGACSLVVLQFKPAREDFRKAKAVAEAWHEWTPLAYSLNSASSLYIQTGQPANAVRVAKEALDGPAGSADPVMQAKLLYNAALGYMEMDRPEAARPYFYKAVDAFLDRHDLESAARAWGGFGVELLRMERLPEAEAALSEGLRLIGTHHLKTSVIILAALARLKGEEGDGRSANALFREALKAPPGMGRRYLIYAWRGEFRRKSGDLDGALADFKEARALAVQMRTDMVPADSDRVAFEQGLSLVYEGLIDAGNQVARKNGDAALLAETFDAAEQDRLWSLQSLIPGIDDWRTKLPENYWELLTRYQSLQRAALGSADNSDKKKTTDQKTVSLGLELAQIEADAGGGSSADWTRSPLAHVRKLLPADTVLFSFHLSKESSWLWAVDREHVGVYALPPLPQLQSSVAAFNSALRANLPSSRLGFRLYRDLFGFLPVQVLKHSHWRLELDGPLYELPFAALVTAETPLGPRYLVEHADIQSLPNALLTLRGGFPADGEFLGISDPVYNPADGRYGGTGVKPALLLTRLPNTATEVKACARAWNSAKPTLLSGEDAEPVRLRAAIQRAPAIIHFATHIVSAPGELGTGLIALSLNKAGEMALLGPKEILANATAARLVVMDGCHSAQGVALPSSGLMGLTRAWMGAGATSVLATQWDIPDTYAQTFMTDFYHALRAKPDLGLSHALQAAQLAALSKPGARDAPDTWAGYLLLSRML